MQEKIKSSEPDSPGSITPPVKVPDSQEAISLEECREYLAAYSLTDEQVTALKNNLIGVVDSILNNYLEPVAK